MSWWDAYHIVLLLGGLQGIVLGVLLWRGNAPRKSANRILAALLFFFAYRLITEVLSSIDVINYNSWTYHIFLEYNWIYGPLIYLYIRSFIRPGLALNKSDWIHFVPVSAEFIISNYVKIQNFYWDGTRDSLTRLGEYAYILWMHKPTQIVISCSIIMFYVFLSRRMIRQYTADDTQPVQMEDINWVRTLLLVYLLFSILALSIGLIDYFFFDYAFNPKYIFPVYIGLAIITYWLALEGYQRRDTPYLIKSSTSVKDLTIDTEKVTAALINAMETEKLFKNPKLTLAILANHIQTQPYQLTHILNRILKKSFSDFVNEYRVDEAERMINSDNYEHFTLLSIAFESGFNSKASFNRIVKKLKGKSPKELKME